MAMFNNEINHKPGRTNKNVDCLSRYSYEQHGIADDVGDAVH